MEALDSRAGKRNEFELLSAQRLGNLFSYDITHKLMVAIMGLKFSEGNNENSLWTLVS
jgi:hypothetical protein